NAIKLIKQQGEGTDTSQGAVDFGGGLSHYYQFDQIVQGKRYVPQGDKTFKLDPSQPIAMPTASDVAAMAPVPPLGYPGAPDADEFDRLYSDMLNKLQDTWTNPDDQAANRALGGAVGVMVGALAAPALRLIATPRDPRYGPGNYGPDFRYLPGAPARPPL